MTKETFFTYHKGHSGKLTAYYAGNIVTYTEKQFTKLQDVILCLNGTDYRITKDNAIAC